MKEDQTLAKWIEEQMKEACKHRDAEAKILGKVYDRCWREANKKNKE